MTSSSRSVRRLRTTVLAVLAVLLFGTVPAGHAEQAAKGILPLGDADLPETSSTTTLAPGVTLTRIVRGDRPAAEDEIDTTTKGPWVVHALSIDPRRARGALRSTFGPDLGQVEKTTELVRQAGALAGVNASFFTFSASKEFPGDPVGLHIDQGKLLSEPGADANEVDFVVDAASNRALIGQLRWSGSIRNIRTGSRLPLEFINHPPVVPASCAALANQRRCAEAGDVVSFTPEFGERTPQGKGVEVVLNRFGCTVRVALSRGTALRDDQSSVQATGRDSLALLRTAGIGCVRRSVSVTDAAGRALPMRKSLFGVNGRYQLTADGRIVVPEGTGSFFARNPRTIAGVAANGRLVLATIDGRQTTSVGTTMRETAAVADALGMRDSVNLDGGGSTAMSVRGKLVSRPSGTTERAVGDALVYVER